MQWLELLKQICEICLVPILTVVTAFVVKLLNKKFDEIAQNMENETAKKYLYMIESTISQCVIMTNQTYVEALKEKDLFDVEAQKEAFEKTYTAVISFLSEDVQNYIETSYGDIQAFIASKIEVEVNKYKLSKEEEING